MAAQCLNINNGMKPDDRNKKHPVMLAVPTSCRLPQGPHYSCMEMTSSMEDEPMSSKEGGEDLLATLRKCRKKKDLGYASRLHTYIHSEGLETQISIGNHLVPLFVDSGGLSVAEQMFYKLNVRNEFSWTSMIQGYVGCGEYMRALDLFDLMQKEEYIHPTRHTYLAVMKACARVKWLVKAREIHETISNDKGFQIDLIMGNTLVDMYAKCGSLDEAQEMLHRMPIRDVVSWNALISGYVENRLFDEALQCLEGLKLDGLTPDCVTFMGSLKACGNERALDRGLKLHAEIVELGNEHDPIVRYSLVEMYAKCGAFTEAIREQQKLPSSDVVSWTVLMAGYTENNLGEVALDCFDRIEQEGTFLDDMAFVCGLKACGISGDIKVCKEIHGKIVLRGFEGNRYIGNILIDTYAKLDCLIEARGVFEEMSDVRDIISWNTLIESYVEHGLAEEALGFLPKIQSEGLTPNTTTFISSLKACGILGDEDMIWQLLVQIVIGGHEKDTFVMNSLVDAFSRCGLFTEARNFFEEMQPVESIVTWNILMSSYADHGLVDDVLSCMEEMQESSVPYDAFTCVISLKAFGSLGVIEKVLNMHMYIINCGFESNILVDNSLMDAYMNCGFLTEAQTVFDKHLFNDPLSWNTFITGLLDNGLVEDCFCYMDRMEMDGHSQDAVTFLCGLRACSMMGLIEKGQEIHAKITKQGIISHPLAGSSLIDMYVKCGFLEEAQYVFDELPDHDAVLWTTLILGISECGKDEQVLGSLKKMQLEGINPNAATYACCLKTCGNMRAMFEGMAIHNEVIKLGFDADNLARNTIIDMYGKLGLFAEVEQVFDGLAVQDAISWNSLISAFSARRENGEFHVLFAQMQEQGLLPNRATFAILLEACGNTPSFDNGRRVHAQIRDTNGDKCRKPLMETALIDMYSKCGSMADAQRIFDATPVKDFLTWTALITGYARRGSTERVCYMLERMIEEGAEPDEVTFLSVLNACSHGGLVEQGRGFYKAMIQEYDMILTAKHHSCMVDLLGRAGQLNEAVAMLEKLRIKPDLVTWSAVLSGCQKWGDVDLAIQCTERIEI